MKLRKVGIIGTGHVGSHVAFSLALQGEVDELYIDLCSVGVETPVPIVPSRM